MIHRSANAAVALLMMAGGAMSDNGPGASGTFLRSMGDDNPSGYGETVGQISETARACDWIRLTETVAEEIQSTLASAQDDPELADGIYLGRTSFNAISDSNGREWACEFMGSAMSFAFMVTTDRVELFGDHALALGFLDEVDAMALPEFYDPGRERFEERLTNAFYTIGIAVAAHERCAEHDIALTEDARKDIDLIRDTYSSEQFEQKYEAGRTEFERRVEENGLPDVCREHDVIPMGMLDW